MRLALLLALPLAACGGMTSSDDDVVDCSTVTGVDTFVVGLEHQGVNSAIDFKLMSIDPAPAERGDNTWLLQLNAMDAGVVGAPLDGVAIAVTPYMPAHMHTSPITAKITAKGSGQYELSPVNLWMPGVWETTVTATMGASSDRAVFKFCIP